MKVSHRLYLASVPAVLGVFAVAGLAYWGQYAHTVPELLLVVAAIASVGTLIMAWTNVRYVAQRVQRIAGVDGDAANDMSLTSIASAVTLQHVSGNSDELDAIEFNVARLNSAIERAERGRREREQTFEQRAGDYARMLAAVAQSAERALEQVRLPLHILLDNHFGELNENQEELLGVARNAAENADAELVALRQIAELDLGNVQMRRDRVLPADIVRAIAPTIKAVSDLHGVILTIEIEPLVPAVMTDQAAMQEALSALLSAAISCASNGSATLTLAGTPGAAHVTLVGAARPDDNVHIVRARRVVTANGGSVSYAANGMTIGM